MIIVKASKVEKKVDGRYDIHFDLFGILWYGGPGAPQTEYFSLKGDGKDVYCYPSSEEKYQEQQRTLAAAAPQPQQPKESPDDTIRTIGTKRLILERLGQISDLRAQLDLLIAELPREQQGPLLSKTQALADQVQGFFRELTEK